MARHRILIIAGISIVLWGGFSIAAYFVAHKPFIIQLIRPLASLSWSLTLTGILTVNALSAGRIILGRIIPQDARDSSRIILAGGIGLGALGVLGFGLAVSGATKVPILLSVQIAFLVFFIWRGEARQGLIETLHLLIQLRDSSRSIPAWMRWAAALALTLTFFRTLLPPIEAYDALLYHLTIPDLWIRDGGLRAYNFPHYWFPGLVEGVFLWGLGLGSEIVPQQMHLLWGILLSLLLWHWTRALWGNLTSWWSLMIMISMPSLLLLASWAYTDLALTFYGLAALYCLWTGMEHADTRWWIASGAFAGLAMGIKYTSFIVPVTTAILIAVFNYRQFGEMLRQLVRFSFVSLLTGSAWYLRTWIWMGNPFYPFVFSGRFWDSFRAAAFSGAGSGIGWDWKAILALPLTVTLGYQDINYFDGNVGPLFLATLPLAFLLLVRFRALPLTQKRAAGILFLYFALSAAFWVYGYVTTRNLWQTRLLFPALIPFIAISSAGLAISRQLDTKRFRASFIVHALAALSIALTLFDATLGVVARNPLAVAAGLITREAYFEKHQPAFYHAMKIIAAIPPDSSVYSVLEPRSYRSPRWIQPDPILDNFSHDVFLYNDPQSIVEMWRSAGYTHVLVNMRGANLVYEFNLEERKILDETLDSLHLIAITPEGGYAFYAIPAP